MNIILTPAEARVLGCLVEKEITTPEYYPLSLNALIHACNQKSNRDPVFNLDEPAVQQALRGLGEHALARSAGGDSRVAKFEHRLAERFNFTRPEIAVLCELLLRGPQTPGELRSRAGRMHPFEDLSVVHTALKRLAEREPPLVELLARQPGTKEARYGHLFFGQAPPSPGNVIQPIAPPAQSNVVVDPDQLNRLEAEVAGLRAEVADLRRRFADFQKQFD